MMASLIVLVLPALLVWRGLRGLADCHPAERAGLAIALWLGTSAVVHFLLRWIGVPHLGALVIEFAAALACAWWPWTGVRAVAGSAPELSAPTRDATWFASVVVLCVGAAAGATIVARRVMALPHGAWDAWAIWNLQAAFLAQDSDAWRGAFTAGTAISHPDYPALVPSAVARAWALVGTDATWVPAMVSVAFLAATALVVAGSAWRLRGPAVATASSALLLSPAFLVEGAAQQADVPLACFSVLAMVMATGAPRTTARLVLVGMLCGCAAWTKNEGLIIALALPTLLVVELGRRGDRQRAMDGAADLAIGLLPFLAAFALFKLFLAPEGDIALGLSAPGAWRYWLDPGRVWFVAREMALGVAGWSGWGWPSVAWLAAAALWRFAPARSTSRGIVVGGVLLLQGAAFFIVYVMTPHSVASHLQTSWPRLIAQLWPLVVWGAVLGRGRASVEGNRRLR